MSSGEQLPTFRIHNMILIKVGKHLAVDKTEDVSLQFLFAVNLSIAASKVRTVN